MCLWAFGMNGRKVSFFHVLEILKVYTFIFLFLGLSIPDVTWSGLSPRQQHSAPRSETPKYPSLNKWLPEAC